MNSAVADYCCICDAPVAGEGRTLAGRTYCVRHFERIAHDNKAAMLPIVYEVGALVVFAALVALIASMVDLSPTGPMLVLLGVVLAIVPAAIWLMAFYRLDRFEPEPKHHVLGVFVLGAVLAEAIARPLIADFFQVNQWLYENPLVGILGSILVIGMVQEFLKYAAVRYTVFQSAEFDERVDGIIYGAAAGLGFATMLNIRYVVERNGVDIGVGVIQIAVTALAHASFSGVMGYFLGRAKFERMGPLWLPLGLALAATLNGLVSYTLRQLPLIGDFAFNPWYGLIAAGLIAVVTFAVLFSIIRRANAATLAAVRAS